MSYLEAPRIHFSGRFQADTSTINNDVRHYDSAKFNPSFQEPLVSKDDEVVRYNGYWNPDGTGAWRMLGCRVTAAVSGGHTYTDSSQDPVVGLVLGDAVDRVAAKLVDLDPQQQMVSQIWGLQVRIQNQAGKPAFVGEFAVAPFADLWLRQQNVDQWLDQQLAAAYQSILTHVTWDNYQDSPTLTALKETSRDGFLSIRMNVFGFDRTPGADDFSTGIVVGTIGPVCPGDPKYFTLGRHLTPALDKNPNLFPFVPANKVANIQAKLYQSGKTLSVDLGNALPITDSIGTLENIGKLACGVLKNPDSEQGQTISADDIAILGEIDYLSDKKWYYQTAGVVDFPVEGEAEDLIHRHPIAIVAVVDDGYQILNRETADGLFVRADNFVYRLNPGEEKEIRYFASQYGHPIPLAITTSSTSGFMGGAGTGAKLDIPIPEVNTPTGILTFADGLETGENGSGRLVIQACKNGPGNPRVYLDGQLYGIAYGPKDPPKNLQTNPFNYISVLVWDAYVVPDQPTWYEHVQPILTQYGNLYPIMSKRLVDLSDYDSVVANLDIMKLSFSLPLHNPNHMPVTRDLSANKTATIIKWMNSKDPKTGLPPLGQKPLQTAKTADHGDTPAQEAEADQPDVGSKVTFMREALRHKQS